MDSVSKRPTWQEIMAQAMKEAERLSSPTEKMYISGFMAMGLLGSLNATCASLAQIVGVKSYIGITRESLELLKRWKDAMVECIGLETFSLAAGGAGAIVITGIDNIVKKHCTFCGKSADKVSHQVCSGCILRVCYCSTECQIQHWALHKQECKRPENKRPASKSAK